MSRARGTRKPCPGCGEEGHRDADSVCYSCRQALERARDAKRHEDARLAAGLGNYRAPAWGEWRLGGGWPSGGVDPHAGLDGSARRCEEDAGMAIAVLVSCFPVGNTEAPSEALLPTRHGWDNANLADAPVEMPRRGAIALRVLSDAIERGFLAAYREGWAAGQDLLGGLARGEVRASEIDDERKQIDRLREKLTPRVSRHERALAWKELEELVAARAAKAGAP